MRGTGYGVLGDRDGQSAWGMGQSAWGAEQGDWNRIICFLTSVF